MSLDPRDSQRLGRSRSPGGREPSRTRISEYETETVRERSRVRNASPPKASHLAYGDSDSDSSSESEDDRRGASRGGGAGAGGRGGGYGYEERETVRRETVTRGGKSDREPPKVVSAEPRGSYGGYGRDDSPPKRGTAGGDPRGGGYGTASTREREREREDRYAIPGSFQEEDTKVRYETSGGRGGREKEYYSETRKETSYGRDREGERDKYGRATSPPRDRERDRDRDRDRYEEVDKYKYAETRDRRYEEPPQPGRERGASFNVSTPHHSVSAGIAVGHGDKRSSYVQPQSPAGYQPPPPSAYQQPPPGYQQPPYGSSGQVPFPEVPGGRQYADPPKWEYAQPDEKLSYTKRTETTTTSYGGRQDSPSQRDYGGGSRHGSTAYISESKYESPRSSSNKIVTVEPGGGGGGRRPNELSPTAGGLAPRMHSLSVSTGHHGGASLSLANAPGSPLLEAYHGTYQSISPMPSPLLIASSSHTDVGIIEPLSPVSSDDDHRGGKKTRRTARFHDPAEEASILAKALKGEKRAPDTAPLIEILPGLTHDQILDLRVEYKRIVKTGHDKKGVNIAKHIKLRMKEEDPSLMKACYACALGKWESEAYWANFWYQGEKSRRELLIESLMGRTNKEIREIKDGFSDKKYGDSLTKCMKMELKEDKFKKAVLLVLEERKMEERVGYGGKIEIDRTLVEDDVHDLHKAVRSEKGGESAMISIIVVRSDGHLREVLRAYEKTYQSNFAREMLKKSGNLVGELLAHILNGVINKPVRDALLVNHALSLSKSDHIRTELLISRLIRYHWDRPHMEAVKREYRARYGIDMQKAVKEGTKGEWGLFCEQLCVRRMGDEVREVRRVEEIHEVRRERY